MVGTAWTGRGLQRMAQDLPKEVLVVEDEPLVRMAAADALVHNGIMTWEAGDASEALSVLEEHPRIGVVFTDINMPGQPNGLGLAKEVSILRPDVELIVTSGAVKFDDAELPDHGVFLPKPYSAQRLVNVVQQKLGETD